MARPGTKGNPIYTGQQADLTVANGAQSAAAAAAGTVIADTGQLAAGTYKIEAILSILGVAVAGVGLVIEHRNAANGATLSVLGGVAGGCTLDTEIDDVVIAQNERVRVVVGAVALPASTTGIASLRAYKKV